MPRTRSVYAERELGGFFLDVVPDREAIARYGIAVRDVLDVVESSIGGMDVASTYEGRERYRIKVRYPRELRDNLGAVRNVLVPITPLLPRPMPVGPAQSGNSMAAAGAAVMSGGMGATKPTSVGAAMGGMSTGPTAAGGGQMNPAASDGMGGGSMGPQPTAAAASAAFVPLGLLAHIEPVMGPPMIKSEMGSLTGWTYVDIDSSDVGGYVEAAKLAVAREVKLPLWRTTHLRAAQP